MTAVPRILVIDDVLGPRSARDLRLLALTLDEAPAPQVFTTDEAGIKEGAKTMFYVAEQIGPKRSFTPEGYLLCQDTPIARVGEMVYGPGETPLPVGDAGYIIIERHDEDVFAANFLASLEGKPVTVGHPRGGVSCDNWRERSVGYIDNPRRGEGDLAAFIVVDLMITEKTAIQRVLAGDVEVSAGYIAEYLPISKGRGRQINMLGNHLALVKAGRCGTRCSIQDSLQGDDQVRQLTMDNAAVALDANHPAAAWYTRLAAAVRAAWDKKDQVALDAALAAAPTRDILFTPGMTNDERTELVALRTRLAVFDAIKPEHVAKLLKLVADEAEESEEEKKRKKDAADEALRVAAAAALDAEKDKDMEEEMGAEAKDKAKTTKDSVLLSDAHQEVAAGAEILVPGISIPALDRAAEPRKTFDCICKLRRTALDLTYATPKGRPILDHLLGGKKLDVDRMSVKDCRAFFRSAVGAMKIANDARRDPVRPATTDRRSAPTSISAYQASLNAHYGPKK